MRGDYVNYCIRNATQSITVFNFRDEQYLGGDINELSNQIYAIAFGGKPQEETVNHISNNISLSLSQMARVVFVPIIHDQQSSVSICLYAFPQKDTHRNACTYTCTIYIYIYI